MADGAAHGGRFSDPEKTADGKERASVAFRSLETLWINTGTLCNIECAHCYIESSPTNDRLDYIRLDELQPFLDEAAALGAREIGFTGGEPFMNPDMPAMAAAALRRGFHVLILTNAMQPLMRPGVAAQLLAIAEAARERCVFRVSLDHFDPACHDEERGAGAFEKSARGMDWIAGAGFPLSVAGRLRWNECETEMRDGYARLFAARSWPLDARDPASLILFPEMDERAEAPEITTECWSILNKDPASVMCASSRMLVKRKGSPSPAVLACTLVPYSEAFEMGPSLAGALGPVRLNHPHCARFCVLGGASCS